MSVQDIRQAMKHFLGVLEQKRFWHDQLSFDDNNSINIQKGTLIIYSKCADI
jgi:hypothetical protein